MRKSTSRNSRRADFKFRLPEADLSLRGVFHFPGYKPDAANRLFMVPRSMRKQVRGHKFLGTLFRVYRLKGGAGKRIADCLGLLWFYFASSRRYLFGLSSAPHLERMMCLLFSVSCQGYSSKCMWEAVEGVRENVRADLLQWYRQAIGAYSYGLSLDLHYRVPEKRILSVASYRSYVKNSPVAISLRLVGRLAPALLRGIGKSEFCEEAHDKLVLFLDMQRESALLRDLGQEGVLQEFLRRPRATVFLLPSRARQALRRILCDRGFDGGELPPGTRKILEREVFTPSNLSMLRMKAAFLAAKFLKTSLAFGRPEVRGIIDEISSKKYPQGLELWPAG